MSRRACFIILLGMLALLAVVDGRTSLALDPYASPPVLALGSGAQVSAGLCTDLPDRK
ncbi:MAG: hypothetical protein AAF442_05175 [Pseudomonadota bacterium]